jgi:hypothetical protein
MFHEAGRIPRDHLAAVANRKPRSGEILAAASGRYSPFR